MTNLAVNLLDAAEMYPDRTAVRLDDEIVTYRQLLERSAAVAAWLTAAGLQPGDRVGLMLPNVPAFAACFYGALAAGAAVVPMNPLLKRREVDFYLADSGAKFLFTAATDATETAAAQGVLARLVNEGLPFPAVETALVPVRREPSDTAVILYTSGTTGRPKGAELTHDNLAGNAEVTSTMLSLGPDDVVMGCLPLFHVFGLTCALNAAVIAGASLTLMARFDGVQALGILQRDTVTVFQGVPTMYSAILSAAADTDVELPLLRLCVSGGAAMPVEILRTFEKRFGCAILEGYGLSETSPVACFNQADQERRPGTIGTPVAGVAMRVIDEAGDGVSDGTVGEIAICGPNVMKGYWNNPEATAATMHGDWFKTGDLGVRDADGYYTIVDRKKDLIIRGGYNVYPREVEEVLYEHPDVREVAVIGIPHAEFGEEIGAAVALHPGAVATPKELQLFVKERLAAYKYPRSVWLVSDLPKGPTGKILRREVVPVA